MHKVYFVGCGPGDPDLLTIKAMKLIKSADVVVYSGSLIPSQITKFCKNGKLYDASKLIREEIFDLLKNSAQKNKLVIRLHDGDPTIYGAIKEQIDNLSKYNIKSEIIPGVTSFLASAASIGTQLTLPGVTQTIIITRAESRTKVPVKEKISALATHNATMVFYLSVHLLSSIVEQITCDGGYAKSTPVAIVYKASWQDQKIIIGTLNDIVQKTHEAKITKTAIIIVGHIINQHTYEYTKLYDKKFTHSFRRSKYN